MKLICPHCGVKGKVDGLPRGRLVKCPKCNEFFRIPFSNGLHETSTALNHSLPVDTAGTAACLKNGIVATEKSSSDKTPPGPETADDFDQTPVESATPEDRTEESAVDDTHAEAWVEVGAEEEAGANFGREPEEVTDPPEDEDFPDYSEKKVAWEKDGETDTDNDHLSSDTAAQNYVEVQDLSADDDLFEDPEEELQAELEAMLSETCSVCGRDSGDSGVYVKDDVVYCPDCILPHEETDDSVILKVTRDQGEVAQLSGKTDRKKPGLPSFQPGGVLSVTAIVKEALRLTKGVKGTIWFASFVFLIVMFGLEAAAALFLPALGAPGGGTITAWLYIGVHTIGTVLSMSCIAGLMYVGVLRVGGKFFSWRSPFAGFARLTHVGIAGFVMTLLIISGFFLLILPGIYLAVGYSLTFPIMLDKNCGPWEAMELSRRHIHERWWQVFGAYLLMYLVFIVSLIPLGIGIIWTIPMFFTLTGVVYRLLLPDRQNR